VFYISNVFSGTCFTSIADRDI